MDNQNQKMNITSKLSLIISAFVIVALCGSHSHAVQNQNESYNGHKRSLLIVNTPVKHHKRELVQAKNSSMVQPIGNNLIHNIFKTSNLTTSNISIKAKQPLVKIQTAEVVNQITHKKPKQDGIFEFFAKFNDKLQQLLKSF